MFRLTTLALAAQLVFADHSRRAKSPTTITIQLDKTFQKMDGFGLSQAFGTAYIVAGLPKAAQKKALDLLFSNTKGAGLTILRNRIGSGGKGDSILPISPGSPNSPPKYEWNGDDSRQVWLSKQAKSYGVKTFYADAWSAPGFMKNNSDQANGGRLCGVTGVSCPSGDWKQAYANMLVQYVKDYKSEGIHITHLGFLNEPDWNTTYSSMLSTGTQAADFIKVLHPTLKSAGLGHVGITCCDATGWNVQKKLTADLISNGVEKMISRITSHAYSSLPIDPMKTSRPVWQTEFAMLKGPFSTIWHQKDDESEGMKWADMIYTGVVKGNLSAYLYWYGVDSPGGAGCLISATHTDVQPSAKLWAFAQWSRFVRPGAVRVGTKRSGHHSKVKFSAFKNVDGTISVQLLNNGTSKENMFMKLGNNQHKLKSAKAFITNNHHLSVAPYSKVTLKDQLVKAIVPPHSMMTVVLS